VGVRVNSPCQLTKRYIPGISGKITTTTIIVIIVTVKKGMSRNSTNWKEGREFLI